MGDRRKVHPHAFIAEYVAPAVELWKANQDSTHLAVHAISQLDNLAEVVCLWRQLGDRRMPDRGEVKKFRDRLGEREAALALLRDAHDCHKHGALYREGEAREGQRPTQVFDAGFFADLSFAGGPPTVFTRVVFARDDGSTIPVFDMIFAAEQAWERELPNLGL